MIRWLKIFVFTFFVLQAFIAVVYGGVTGLSWLFSYVREQYGPGGESVLGFSTMSLVAAAIFACMACC
jgi:hypothetical protein